jgi:hypothetical protein
MSFQKQSSSAKKTQGDAPDKRRVVSLIGLAANLHKEPLLSEVLQAGQKRKTQQVAERKTHFAQPVSVISIYHRAIGKLSVILEELESINAQRKQPPRDSRALRRYIE